MLILALGCQKNELKISSDFDCSNDTVEEREGVRWADENALK
jgi:hypothetical protein